MRALATKMNWFCALTTAVAVGLAAGCGGIEEDDGAFDDAVFDESLLTEELESALARFPALTTRATLGLGTRQGTLTKGTTRSLGFHQYAYSGTAGAKLRFSVASVGFVPFLRVVSPKGMVVANLGGGSKLPSTASKELTLTESGPYRVIVTSWANANAGTAGTSGSYALTLAKVTGASPSAPAASSTVVEVTMSGRGYVPQSLTVKKGTKVRWINTTSITHTVTSGKSSAAENQPGQLFNANLLPKGVFEYTFNTAGNFPYFCVPHEMHGMTGTIVVQ